MNIDKFRRRAQQPSRNLKNEFSGLFPFRSAGQRSIRTLFTSRISHSNSPSSLTHVDISGRALMVSVANKDATLRLAKAEVSVQTTSTAIKLIKENALKKGDAIATARIAGIMAAKQTSLLIPLCHNIVLSKVSIELQINDTDNKIDIESTVECVGTTGVEMEALTACSVAALTIYDMLKAVDKKMSIDGLRVIAKRGGKSDWTA